MGEREKTRIGNWDDAFTIRPEKPRTAVAVAGNVCAPPQVPLMRELAALLLLIIQGHVLGELKLLQAKGIINSII